MYAPKPLTFFLATAFSIFTIVHPHPALTKPFQGIPVDPLVDARGLVNHWESLYNGGAMTLSAFSSLALLTVLPFTTSVALGLSNLALVSASPVAKRAEAKFDTAGPIWARSNDNIARWEMVARAEDASKVELTDGPPWARSKDGAKDVLTDGPPWARSEDGVKAVLTDGPPWARSEDGAKDLLTDGPPWARDIRHAEAFGPIGPLETEKYSYLHLVERGQAYNWPADTSSQDKKRQFPGFEGTQLFGPKPNSASSIKLGALAMVAGFFTIAWLY